MCGRAVRFVIHGAVSPPKSIPPSPDAPEILIAILTDLSVDHRCWKWAMSLRDAGYRPVICCDRPLHPLGTAWDGFDVRVLTRESHQRRFFPVFLAFLLRLLPILLRTKARTWIAMDAPPLLWLAFWGRLRGRRVIYDSHELFLETPLVLSRPSRRFFWTLWEKGGFALIRHCVTVSPAILERLRARHPDVRFRLLPNMPGGPLEDLSPPAAGETRLVYQGGLRKASGLGEFLVALRDRPGIRLDIYGGGPEEGFLRDSTLSLGISDRVRLHGVVPFELLPGLMAGAHAGIHLVQPVCGSFALTLSNKVFDYARAGIPVLLSDNPAHGALLEEFRVGLLADSFSAEAIGRAIDGLLARREFHAAECRKAREAWRWERYFAAVTEILGV